VTDEPLLGEVCLAIVDCEHKTVPVNESGDAWAVGTPAMVDGRIDYSKAKRIDDEVYSKWTRRMVPAEGDLILAREAPVGPVVRVPRFPRVALGQRTVLLRPNPEIVNARYLHFLLLSAEVQNRMHAKSEGSTVRHLNVEDVRTLPIPTIPSISEQERIADVLGALDDKIESNRRIATGCELLLSAFVALAPEHSLVPMSEIAQSTRVSVDPADLGDELVDHFSIPAYDIARLPELCSASTIKSGKFLVERRSVLVSRLNPSTPRVWLADPNGRKAICSTEFLVLGPRDGQMLATVWLAAVSATFLAEAERRATGTSFSHQRIKPDDALTIEVPDIRLLQASQLAEAEAWLERALVARRESAATSALRDALLPELLSGQLRVRDAEKVVGGAV